MEKSALWLYGPRTIPPRISLTGRIILTSCSVVGTGKTTLTYGYTARGARRRSELTSSRSLIIDSFLDDWEPRQSSPVIFFYCDPPLDADQARRPADQPGRFRTADQCARDMLRQLTQLSSPRPAALKHAYGARKQLSGRQCLDFIETMVGDYESITFVLDALDKCAPPEGSDLGALNHVELLERLVLIAKKKEKGRVRVLISTQGQHDWAGRVFVDNPALTVHRISVDSQPPDDIRRFVTLSIRKWTPANFLPRESDVRRERAKDAVVETITKGAATMYGCCTLPLDGIAELTCYPTCLGTCGPVWSSTGFGITRTSGTRRTSSMNSRPCNYRWTYSSHTSRSTTV